MPKISIGITGMSENLDRDDGIEDPFVEPWCPCTANIVPFSAVNLLEYVKVRKSWGPTYYNPPPPPIPPLLYLMKPLINKGCVKKKGKQETKQYSPSSCCNMQSRISVNFCSVSKKLSSRSRNRKGPPPTNKIQKHYMHKHF